VGPVGTQGGATLGIYTPEARHPASAPEPARRPREEYSLATLCRDWRLLFIHGRRTGSTAVRDALHEHLAGEEIPAERELSTDGQRIIVARHSTLPVLMQLGLITPEERAGLTVFTAVRNPFDDLISMWQKNRDIVAGTLERPEQIMTPARVRQLEFSATHTFPEWIAHRWGRKGLAGRFKPHPVDAFAHTEGVDRVLRFETLQEDLNALLKDIGHDGTIELPHVNVTEGRRHYREYYTDAARRTVEQAWRGELERYGYSF
jgi:plasmid stability protein